MRQVRPATDLVRKINQTLEADQGESWRNHMAELSEVMRDAFKNDDGFRSHLGASMIGHQCPRYLWLLLHWAAKGKFDAKTIRLFNRGHAEEVRFIAMLQDISADVRHHDNRGKQFKISDCGGHFGGSCDAVARNVLPDQPNVTVLCEFKTHKSSSFAQLAGKQADYRKHVKDPKNPFTGKGLWKAKPEHFVQMQVYMYKMGIKWGLYFAVNKDTDDIYIEYIPLIESVATSAIEHAKGIIFATEAPPSSLCRDETYYIAKACSMCDVCFGNREPLRNCRTCAKIIPTEDGKWICGGRSGREVLTKEQQHEACDQYRVIEL